jgi:hypothetical protein
VISKAFTSAMAMPAQARALRKAGSAIQMSADRQRNYWAKMELGNACRTVALCSVSFETLDSTASVGSVPFRSSTSLEPQRDDVFPLPRWRESHPARQAGG